MLTARMPPSSIRALLYHYPLYLYWTTTALRSQQHGHGLDVFLERSLN
jgi:hypothetical protein